MQVEAGDVLEERCGADVRGDVRVLLKDVREVLEPFLGQEEGARLVTRGEGPAEHPGGLGDVHALGGFPELAQVHVRELGVVRNPGVVGGVKAVEGHGRVT